MNSTDIINKILSAKQKEEQSSEIILKSRIDEKQSLEIERLSLEVEELRLENNRTHRIHLVRIIGLALLFLLVVGWLIAICVFLILSGKQVSGTTNTYLQLSDAVIISLIGSTTINVIGLFHLAAKWLYPNYKERD